MSSGAVYKYGRDVLLNDTVVPSANVLGDAVVPEVENAPNVEDLISRLSPTAVVEAINRGFTYMQEALARGEEAQSRLSVSENTVTMLRGRLQEAAQTIIDLRAQLREKDAEMERQVKEARHGVGGLRIPFRR